MLIGSVQLMRVDMVFFGRSVNVKLWCYYKNDLVTTLHLDPIFYDYQGK